MLGFKEFVNFCIVLLEFLFYEGSWSEALFFNKR